MIRMSKVAFVTYLLIALSVGIMVGGSIAPAAHASAKDEPTLICAHLRDGVTLVDLMHRLSDVGGMRQFDAGAATGYAVRDHCPDQRDSVIAQLPTLQQAEIEGGH